MLDLKKVLTDLDGNSLTTLNGKPLTLGKAISDAFANGHRDVTDAKQKLAFYALAKTFNTSSEIELDETMKNDIGLLVNSCYPPLIVGQIWEELNK